MARKVILDLDPGVDDAVAMVMALFDPRLEVLAVTAVAGNVSADQATHNLQALIEQLDPPRWPRLGAAAADDVPLVDRRHIHGANGLGDAEFACAELHHVTPAEKVIADAVRSAPEEVTFVALGPLTNLARAIQRDPALVNLMGQVVISGGAIHFPGNVTPAAEFNIYANPAAARFVLRQPLTKTLVPLNITSQVMLGFDVLERIPGEGTPLGDLLHAILPYAFRMHRRVLGMEGIHLADSVALAATLLPEAFSTEMMAVDVEIQGEITLGATIADLRAAREWRANSAVVTEVDRTAVVDAIVGGLHRAAGRG